MDVRARGGRRGAAPNAFRPVASNALGVVTATESNPNVGRYYIEGVNYGLPIADRTIDDTA